MAGDYAATLDELRRELKKADKPANRMNYQQFFKEKLEEPTGLRTNVVRTISKDVYKRVGLKPEEALDCAEYLLASGERYMTFFAFEWGVKANKLFKKSDFARFERWIKEYVTDWGKCDHICGGLMGMLLQTYPDLVARTHKWRRSRNRWLKRAAAVSLILPVRKGLLFDEVTGAADAMLTDPDDMVQKGYGWTLKESCKMFEDEVYAFVMARRDRMPRTALRYAIEKMPPKRRAECMKRVG